MSRQALPVLNAFPAIKQLGQQRLQELCDAFRASHVAREFAISELRVESIGEDLSLTFACEFTHSVQPDEEYHFPIDELLRFIADNGIPDAAVCERTKRAIAAARRRAGPHVYRRFKVNLGSEMPLFLTCKNQDCGNLMQTQLMGRASDQWELSDVVKCPRCGHSYTYAAGDLHFGPR